VFSFHVGSDTENNVNLMNTTQTRLLWWSTLFKTQAYT